MVVECPPGSIINPATGRCVDRNGTIGRRVVRHTAKQVAINNMNLPEALAKEIWGYLPYNCGSFIRDMRAMYGDLNAANAQTKGRLRRIVIKSLQIFKSRLSKTHLIKRSFMRDLQMQEYLQTTLGKRIDMIILNAQLTVNMNDLVTMCKDIVNMKREAVAIVEHTRRFVHYVDVFLHTGAQPQDWLGNLVVTGNKLFSHDDIPSVARSK